MPARLCEVRSSTPEIDPPLALTFSGRRSCQYSVTRLREAFVPGGRVGLGRPLSHARDIGERCKNGRRRGCDVTRNFQIGGQARNLDE
jgi:hypothetical protein